VKHSYGFGINPPYPFTMKHCFVGQVAVWAFAQVAVRVFIGSDAVMLKSKTASLLELKAETVAEASMKNGPLFPVTVAYDWKKHDPAEGVSILMDKMSGALKMVTGISTSTEAVAWGYMLDELSKNGWIKLFIQTTDSDQISNDVRMYAAGYIEGVFTAVRISQFYSNFYQTLVKDQTVAGGMQILKKVFNDELEYVKTNSNIHPGVMSTEPLDPFWKHMRYQFVQLWALKDGYNFCAMGH
jgi:hypothetical protein